MERYFIFENLNTWYDWSLIITAKDIPDPEPKTNYVDLNGMNGTLDLSEALTGEITYNDRTITASFWTNYGTRKDRETLLRKISATLHGKKVKIIEPDDPDHYFYGRVKIKSPTNNLAYATFTIEAICEPWRYALTETVRRIDVNGDTVTDVVINNNGVKSLSPIITVTGSVNITYGGTTTTLTDGVYKISDIKLRQGVNIIGVSGAGSVSFSYREATL
jgi:predicted phage tail component-like protein